MNGIYNIENSEGETKERREISEQKVYTMAIKRTRGYIHYKIQNINRLR